MPPRLEINAGQLFGDLVVVVEEIEPRSAKNRRYFSFLCKCGTIFPCRLNSVTSGTTKSCGCFQKEAVSKANTKHGMCNTNLYEVWEMMIQRCTNPSNKAYKNYGARGISVSPEWKNFVNFYMWAKDKYKDGLWIERLDNNLGYSESNCDFVTPSQNTYNRRRDSSNTPGKTGVIWDEDRQKWYVSISHDYIGRFENFEDAVRAREQAEIDKYGFNVKH